MTNTATAAQSEAAAGRNATHAITGAMQSDATNVTIAYALLPTKANPAPGQIRDRLIAFLRISASSTGRGSSLLVMMWSVAIMLCSLASSLP